MPIPFYKPAPSPPNAFRGVPLPRTQANWLSTLFFHWITPILRIGYSRPLEAEDLWELTPDLRCQPLATALDVNLQKRMPPSKRRNADSHGSRLSELGPRTKDPSSKKLSKTKAKQLKAGTIAVEDGTTYDMSLWKAIYMTVWRQWWWAVTLNGVGNALKLTSPLVTRLTIEQLILAHTYHRAETSGSSLDGLRQPKSVGYGIGLAVGLFAMEFTGAIFEYQSAQIAAVQGCCLRAAVVDLISRKSMRLSGKARQEMTSGRLNTMVSSDTSFLDWAFPASIELPTGPILIVAGIGLLVYTLGVSALVGLGILIGVAPFQGWLFCKLMSYRGTQEKIVDQRVRLLTEIINNIRAVKLYAYETFFGEKVTELRTQELAKLKGFGLMHALINSTFYFLPILAAVLTFVTYSLTGDQLNAAIVFSALQFFNVLRQPISRLPMIIAAAIDAVVALGRIGAMLRADELEPKLCIEHSAKFAINVNGDFTFESLPPTTEEGVTASDKAKTSEDEKEKAEATPFCLRNIQLEVPRGALVCVVGRVGTGKSALLLGMINEMRQTRGHTLFGGTVSYVPQEAWVQSGSVSDNITFSASAATDPVRTAEVIKACGLGPDMDRWDDREHTYIGERGITLSGGQRQRICVARAAYAESDIVLLDDPLSALDANVGHHLLHHCILSGPLAHRTRILVTHHLDVLPQADWIIMMDSVDNEGRISQQGTYAQLLAEAGPFRTLIKDFGSVSDARKTEPIGDDPDFEAPAMITTTQAQPKTGTRLMLDEERLTGEVQWSTYTRYLKAVGSWRWAVIISIALVMEQAATVGNSLMLGYWSEARIYGFSQGDYMAVCAGFGLAVAIASFIRNYSMILAGISASFHLFNYAWSGVIRSPVSWHDRTPSGRIISRLSKDVQMMDDRLASYWSESLSECLAVLGTFALVAYTFPLLCLFFIPLTLFFYISATYYRQTSRELKRLDSILRSHIYSSFGEQLSGNAVIRAFGKQAAFERRLQGAIDTQNKAYILSITCQRWLSVRLQFASQLLILGIAIFGSIFRNTVNPAQFGVVLTYALHAALVLTALVPLFAVCEQEMNNVERIEHYTDLEAEPAATYRSDPSPDDWPTAGAIEFEDVQLRYRPELPLVLKGISFKVRPGEKVGIIGRTGAGKSSVTQALFRMVEICGGGIWIDGRSISDVGLETLRSRVAIIPQDAFLFEGTVRANIDPKGLRSDAELNDLLAVVRNSSSPGSSLRDKLQLDAEVTGEGGNFSVGERQLLALVRAMSRRCKILVLDEATSSVDLETDALIQRIIQTQLGSVTLISIAHRLQTVAYYDRIIVMDQGQIVESGTPLNLYEDTSSLFRQMCDTKKLGIRDILKIRDDASTALLKAQRTAYPRPREIPGRTASGYGSPTTYMDIPSVFARYF